MISLGNSKSISEVQQLEETERERREHEARDPNLQIKITEIQEELKSVNISPK